MSPQESFAAAASTDHAEQESSLIAVLAPGSTQKSVHLQISSGDVPQDDDTVGQLIAPDGTERIQLTLGELFSGKIFASEHFEKKFWPFALCITKCVCWKPCKCLASSY